MANKTSKMGGYTLTEICAVVVAVIFLAVLIIPMIGTKHYSGSSRGGGQWRTCIRQLSIIDEAKGEWYTELHKELTDIPTSKDIQPYLNFGPGHKGGELPFCPNDPKHTFETSYSLNNVRTVPTCRIVPATHFLEHGTPPDMSCVDNLRMIDAAKQQWALEFKKKHTDHPAGSDIKPYIGALPVCPADTNNTFETSYSINDVGTKPKCKILPTIHILP